MFIISKPSRPRALVVWLPWKRSNILTSLPPPGSLNQPKMSDNSKETSSDSISRFTPILIVAIVAMAFAVGALWQKVQHLENGGAAIAKATPTAAVPSAPTTGKLTEDLTKAIPEVTDADHIRGSRDAKVILIEYSDYYCPFCASFHATAQKATAEYGDDFAWVYRHFPLDTLHPNARAVAEIAECVASEAGEETFWKFTDKVYENSPATTDAALDLAGEVGANRASVESCFNEGKFKDKVEDQYQDGVAAGVNGTPGNFILNQAGEAWKLPGAVPFENLSSTLDEALGK